VSKMPYRLVYKSLTNLSKVSQEVPQRAVQTFIDLVQRHEQAFYTFVHNVHSKGQGLFDALMSWLELFLSYARDGLGEPMDLDFILPAGGPAREAIMAEIDSVAQYHYRLKVAHEEKLRRRFDTDPAKGGDIEEQALLESVLATLSLSEAVSEAADMESDDDDLNEDADDADSEPPVSPQPSPNALPATDEPVLASSNTKSLPPLPTPDHLDPDLPSLNTLSVAGASKKNRRSSSNTSSRASVEIFRGKGTGSLTPNRPLKYGEKIGTRKDDHRPVDPSGQKPKSDRQSRKAKKAVQALLNPPETKSIEELRPLFVEMVSFSARSFHRAL
jgi:hypothetical protein